MNQGSQPNQGWAHVVPFLCQSKRSDPFHGLTDMSRNRHDCSSITVQSLEIYKGEGDSYTTKNTSNSGTALRADPSFFVLCSHGNTVRVDCYMTLLLDLPEEILIVAVECVVVPLHPRVYPDTYCLLTFHTLHQIGVPILYRSIHLLSMFQADRVERTIVSKPNVVHRIRHLYASAMTPCFLCCML